MSLPSQDRRAWPRTPHITRLVLPWREERLKVFVTDSSRSGLFVRTQVVPRVGSEVVLVYPEARAFDECVRIDGTVVRYVRRGDPHQPLGGVGIQLTRLISPRGTGPARHAMKALFGGPEPDLPSSAQLLVVELPAWQAVRRGAQPSATPPAREAPPLDATRPVTISLAVFCRWRNMIIQANLERLGLEQAILTRLKVTPNVGDAVKVRILAVQDRQSRGVEFIGQVDQVKPDSDHGTVVSLALDPTPRQPDPGGLLAFLRKLTGAPGGR